MRMTILVAALWAFLVPSVGQQARAAADQPVSGQFTLTRQSDDQWRAHYCFDEKILAFKFDRPMTGDMRQNYWSAAVRDFVLAVNGADGTAEISRVDGAAFSCFELKVKTYTQMPEKNYYAFSTFSDGGVSLFTGYFMGVVQTTTDWYDTQLSASYVPRSGGHMYTRISENLVHQHVYFGPQVATELADGLVIVDPAMPALASDGILKTLSAVNSQLSRVFGADAVGRVSVYMAAGELDAFDGYSQKGGALQDQILFTLKGRGGAQLAERQPTYYPKLAGHELIHILQQRVWPMLGNDRPWVHEGSADALAFEVMRLGGIYTPEKYASVWQQVAGRCAADLAKSSVHDGPVRGNFKIVYTCGALINQLSGGLVDPTDPGRGVMKLWQQMAAWPDADRATDKSEQLFFKTLEHMGAPKAKVEKLRAFLTLKPEDPKAAVAALRQAVLG